MHCDISSRSAAILIAAATATLFMLAPVGAQVAGPAATPAALPAPIGRRRAAPARLRGAGREGALRPAARAHRAGVRRPPSGQDRRVRLVVDLRRRRQPRRPPPIRAGSRTSSRGGSPGDEITVLNRGVNGDEAADMLARLDTAVIAEKPDLVLWQVGTNSVLRDKAVLPHATLLHEGLARLKAIERRYRADRSAIRPQGDRQAACRRHGRR